MFRNYLAAALNNLSRNRLYAAISILGLAVGMAAAILTGLYIRDELSFDHFIPGHDQIYVVTAQVQLPGRADINEPLAPPQAYRWLMETYPGALAARRMASPADMGHGDFETVENIDWVDPDFFKLLSLKAVAGDPLAAVSQPDGVVLTRSMARKFFGTDAPLGQLLQIRRSSYLRVRAVIEDLPRDSHLSDGIFGSGLNANSNIKRSDAFPYRRGNFPLQGATYVRFRNAEQAAQAIKAMPQLVRDRMTLNGHWSAHGLSGGLSLIPLDRLHLAPFRGSAMGRDNVQGDPNVLWSLGVIAALILAMAAINFINLATARAARRAVEVGVRKASGARRNDLIIQFIGEAVIYAALGLVCACAFVELSLPALNAALLHDMRFQPWRDPGLLAALAGLVVMLGVLSGLYPALVLSGFKPAVVLKGGGSRAPGSQAIRGGLVTIQFAVLIGLLLSTAVIVQQTRFALDGHLNVATNQVLVLDLQPSNRGPVIVPPPLCRDALADEIRRLPGVKEAACASLTAMDQGEGLDEFALPNGRHTIMATAPLDAGFFELYGVRPIAGRTLTRNPADEAHFLGSPPTAWTSAAVVLNEKAARQIGFADPARAVGSTLRFTDSMAQFRPVAGPAAVIVGVIPDFALDLVHAQARPEVYIVLPAQNNQMSIKLNGRDIRGTIAAIDALWKRLGAPRAVAHRFLNEQLNTVYVTVIRQELLITALAAVAIFIACLGLFGMAAFTAERRTKEIGVRKVMGASRIDIVRLLLWQFTTPVLWASLIALPLAWWAMDRWLHGFSARIELQPWLFAAAPAAAVLIAWGTVLAHTLKIAAEKPAGALRYE